MAIANSGSDENGRYKGGQAGDQTGKEWIIRNWYNRPWDCVLRYPVESVRRDIGLLAGHGANNDKIGYDQSQRGTFWQQLKTTPTYDPEAITVPCEADCSSGVAAIVKAAGHRNNVEALKNVSPDLWTGNMRQALKAAGFEVLTDSKYLTSDKYLLAGDILLNEKSHTAVQITDGSAANNAPSTPVKPATPSPAPSAPATPITPVTGANIAVDGIWGKDTTRALQRFFGTPQDGIVSSQMVAYKAKNPALLDSSWEWVANNQAKGSTVIRAMQCRLNVDRDGILGDGTVKALQKHMGTGVDGRLDYPSPCVKELQRRLNAGTF